MEKFNQGNLLSLCKNENWWRSTSAHTLLRIGEAPMKLRTQGSALTQLSVRNYRIARRAWLPVFASLWSRNLYFRSSHLKGPGLPSSALTSYGRSFMTDMAGQGQWVSNASIPLWPNLPQKQIRKEIFKPVGHRAPE